MTGRRPDKTNDIARRIQNDLTPGEQVLAGVHVQRPGTAAAGIEGAAAGAAAGALTGSHPTTLRGEDSSRDWAAQLAAVGADPAAANTIRLILALTDRRLLLYVATRISGRPKEKVADWPLTQVDSVDVPRNGNTVKVTVAGTGLELELPQAHKFLPDVYRNLPKLHTAARNN